MTREEYAGLLIDRLAAAIVDESLPLKDVERELRGCVADVAVHRRGLGKRETASRCGVTEKSIENYLKEVRSNPKSPEREVARLLQDKMLSLEEVYEAARPVLCSSRNFSLDDAKRAIDKLIRTGEVREYPGRKYRAIDRPSIRYPETLDAHRELVDQKARDLDYIVLTQKDAGDDDLQSQRGHRYARVVGDTSLVRVDFTVKCAPEELPSLYERITEEIAKITMKFETKKGASRIRMLLGFRAAMTAVLVAFLSIFPVWRAVGGEGEGGGASSWELDTPILRGGDGVKDSSLPTPEGRPRVPRMEGPRLLLGDIDLDDRVGLTDAILLTKFLAGDVPSLACARVADVNRDEAIDLSDVMGIFEALYFGTGLVHFGWVDGTGDSSIPCEEFELHATGPAV